MLGINSLVIIFPIISAQPYNPPIEANKFAETISYDTFSINEPGYKNTMNYNMIYQDQLVRERNEQLLLEIIKQRQCDSNSMVE